jgi:hypothetical protein
MMEITGLLPHGHVAAALGAIRKLGLARIVSKKRCRERDLVIAMIVSRLLNPSSKLASATTNPSFEKGSTVVPPSKNKRS